MTDYTERAREWLEKMMVDVYGRSVPPPWECLMDAPGTWEDMRQRITALLVSVAAEAREQQREADKDVCVCAGNNTKCELSRAVCYAMAAKIGAIRAGGSHDAQ